MRIVAAVVASGVAWLLAAAPARAADPVAEVREVERAFAKTMADRDFAAFGAFLAEEAVFAGPRQAFHGKAEVLAGWKRFFEGPKAPFSWEPETVEVVASGGLALSRGPVHGEGGKRTGTFISTWRREADGKWRIVLDTGTPYCPDDPRP